MQAELELPAPAAPTPPPPDGADAEAAADPAWWQSAAVVGALAALAVLLLVLSGTALYTARGDRARAEEAATRVKTLTLRATTQEHTLRVVPNPRSWSASPDLVLRSPEPPELLDLFLPVAYSEFAAFALTIDKVDQGRVLIVQRIVPDSNRDLRLSLNSSAFGPGEYRIRLQGYTWQGGRVDAGWVRLVMER